MNKQLYKITKRFFRQLDIPVTDHTLENLLLSHPKYLALSLLSSVCAELNIEHVAIETTSDKLLENGLPAIIHLHEKGGVFAILHDINKNIVKYYHPNKGMVHEKLHEFEEKWSKIVFYADNDNISGENNYKLKHSKEMLLKLRFPFLILSIILIIGHSLNLIHPIFSSLFLLILTLKIIGLFVSINLVLHSLGSSTKLTNKVCHKGKHTNCDEVLNSPASKLFGLLSMSDIGFVYFTGGILSLLFSLLFNNEQPTMTFLQRKLL